MLVEKDLEVADWIGRLGAAGAEHVIDRFGLSRTSAYVRLRRLVGGGLLAHSTLLYRQPGLYLATADGLRWCGLRQLGVYRVGPGGFQHARQVAWVAVRLHRAFPEWRFLSERELRFEESAGDLVASAKLGEHPGGRPLLHRPDLVLIGPDGRTLALELELSVKAPRRLAAICRGWARARHVDHIYYLAAPAPARAVSRAIQETRAHDRITVLSLGDPAAIAAAEEQAGALA